MNPATKTNRERRRREREKMDDKENKQKINTCLPNKGDGKQESEHYILAHEPPWYCFLYTKVGRRRGEG